MKDILLLIFLITLFLYSFFKISCIEKYKEIDQEIFPRNPYVVTTALDEKNTLEVKRTIRDTTSIVPFGMTGGLHKEKIKLKNTWFRT